MGFRSHVVPATSHTRGFDVLSSETLSGSIRLQKIICILLWDADVRTVV